MAQRVEGSPQRSSCRHVFRGIEYVLTLVVNKEENSLTIEVEDRLTADQWRGHFDARYIEDLTHKTGNFKQFMVFANMLETSLSKGSSALSLDLLTYSDLEVLRNQRTHRPGAGTQHIPPAKTSTTLHTKRYLIMTYSVEFDRIHYPLPLPYVGKPDPVQLQETIRKLNEENSQLRDQILKGSRNGTVIHLQKENEKVTREKDNIQAEFDSFKRELMHTEKANTTKEIRVLKKVVQNLESDLMKEKTKHQRIINKKNKEYRNLVEELEELRASERNLRARCRSLTNELAVFKRGSRISPAPSNTSARRSSSRGSVSRSRRSISHDRRSASRDRGSVPRDRGSVPRNRGSVSRDRGSVQRDRRSTSRDRLPSSGGRRKRTPSPAGPCLPRFDPTAYVQEKQRKIQESQNQRGRKRTLSGGSLPRGRSRSLSSDRLVARQRSTSRGSASKIALPRTSSGGSIVSRRSSQSSTEGIALTDQSNGQARRRKSRSSKAAVTSNRGKENSRPSGWPSPDASDTESCTDSRQPRVLRNVTPIEYEVPGDRSQEERQRQQAIFTLNPLVILRNERGKIKDLMKCMKENIYGALKVVFQPNDSRIGAKQNKAKFEGVGSDPYTSEGELFPITFDMTACSFEIQIQLLLSNELNNISGEKSALILVVSAFGDYKMRPESTSKISPPHYSSRRCAHFYREVIKRKLPGHAKSPLLQCSLLHLACALGDAKCVEHFLSSGTPADIEDAFMRTPLVYTANDKVFSLLSSRGALINKRLLVQYVDRIHDFSDYESLESKADIIEDMKRIAERLVKTIGDKLNNSDDKNEKTPLVYACETGDVDLVHALINAGANANTSDKNGKTPLIYACAKSNLEIITLLVKAGADVDAMEGLGSTPLLCACEHENCAVMEMLLNAKANVDGSNNFGTTPLIYASLSGYVGIVEMLIKAEANVNTFDEDEQTPLLYACFNGNPHIVSLLIQAGADVNVSDTYETTPLCHACEIRSTDIVRLLVDAGADINITLRRAFAENDLDTLRLLVEAGANVNARDADDRTVLIRACHVQNVDIVQLIVEAGADVNGRSVNDRMTPLISTLKLGHLDIVRLLVDNEADVNSCDGDGMTPLIQAIELGYPDIVRLFVGAGADVNAHDGDGMTPLIQAAKRGHLDIVRLLLDAGADVNARDGDGMTPLIQAAKRGHLDIIRILVDAEADVNACDGDGMTPLLFAFRKGHLAVVRLLVDAGANVNVCDGDGMTPLIYASKTRHLDIVRLLVYAGANVNAEDANGLTPLSYAYKWGQVDSVRLLVNKGANVNTSVGNKRTPLIHACIIGKVEIVQLLIKAGAE